MCKIKVSFLKKIRETNNDGIKMSLKVKFTFLLFCYLINEHIDHYKN